MIVIDRKTLDNGFMKAKAVFSKIKENVEDLSRVVSEMDRDKARHLMDQLAQAGFHEVVRLRGEAKRRFRLKRSDLTEQGAKIVDQAEKFQKLASAKAQSCLADLQHRFNSERHKWHGRRRSK